MINPKDWSLFQAIMLHLLLLFHHTQSYHNISNLVFQVKLHQDLKNFKRNAFFPPLLQNLSFNHHLILPNSFINRVH